MKDERVDEIFGRIEELNIDLDYDPIERGPKFLNNQIARCRNYNNEVQKFMREVQAELRQIERVLHLTQAQFDLKFDDLMANDPQIVSMRNLSKSDREATARTKLRDTIEEINELENERTNLKHVETVIDSKLRELRDVTRDLKMQHRLIQAEIETGAMWGNDHGAQDTQSSMPDSIDDTHLAPDPDAPEPENDEPDYDELFTVEDLDNEDSDGIVGNDTSQNVSNGNELVDGDESEDPIAGGGDFEINFDDAISSLS